MSLSDLPPELLAKVFSYLPDCDICNAALTCRIFQEAVNIDLIWQEKCHAVLPKHLLERGANGTTKFTSFEIYTKLLKKYGFLVGTWQPEMDCYGGLVSVQYKDNVLTGIEYKAPRNPHVSHPLRPCVLFTVGLTSNLTVEVLCHQGYNGPHPCLIIEKENDVFQFECEEKESHNHPDGADMAFQQYLWEELDSEEEQQALDALVNIQLLEEKFKTHLKLGSNFLCNRITLPKPKTDVIIQPGLFKGMYGSHGIELLTLDYDDSKNEALITKVTGDPNVFANKVSVCADLKRPMVLTTDQQQSVRTLKEIDIPDVQPNFQLSGLPQQPFQVPYDCFERGTEAPKHCIVRFHAKGQVAGHRFTSPSFIPCHWVVFDENCFGNVWLDLRSFSLFYRVQEEFV